MVFSQTLVVRHYMIKLLIRIIVGLLIIFFGVKAVRQEFGGYELGLFHQFQYIPFFLLLLFTIAIFLVDTTFYKLDHKIIQYTFSFIGLTFCAFVIYKIIQRNSIDNSKTILSISNKAAATNVMAFEFKDNEHFRLTEYGRVGQTVYYGKYCKQQDTLKILETNYDGYAKELPKTGIIKSDTVYWNRFDTMLIDKE